MAGGGGGSGGRPPAPLSVAVSGGGGGEGVETRSWQLARSALNLHNNTSNLLNISDIKDNCSAFRFGTSLPQNAKRSQREREKKNNVVFLEDTK